MSKINKFPFWIYKFCSRFRKLLARNRAKNRMRLFSYNIEYFCLIISTFKSFVPSFLHVGFVYDDVDCHSSYFTNFENRICIKVCFAKNLKMFMIYIVLCFTNLFNLNFWGMEYLISFEMFLLFLIYGNFALSFEWK